MRIKTTPCLGKPLLDLVGGCFRTCEIALWRNDRRAGTYSVMTLHWAINSESLLITARGEGPLSFRDVDDFHSAIAGAKVLAYRRYVDLSCSEPSMTSDEIMLLAALTRKLHQRGEMGALAIVVGPAMFEVAKPLFGVLACANRPMRVFSGPTPARRWISNLALPTRH